MTAHYTGELDLHFLRHGKGEYKYPNGVFRFSGGWKTGAKNGHGVFAVEGGSTFEGNFVDGEIEGKGFKQWEDGRRYEGEFSRGEASGDGRFTSPTGESYVGTWAQNRRHGRGQLVLPDGQGSYDGEFQNHRYHGEGQLLLASGFGYSGTFFNGLPHGLGLAIYPGGSTFKGLFESGRKNGGGGKYMCGFTGICWTGEWAAGKAVSLPSKWAIEMDSADRLFGVRGDEADHTKTGRPGAKEEKVGGGKKSGKASKKTAEGVAGDDIGKPIIARFNDDAVVAGLWCRCVRDVELVSKPEIPPAPSELDKNAEESTNQVRESRIEVVSNESGRTLAITLHEVKDSPPGSIGAPAPFFVRRPDATDISESLGRFPVDGLIALFQREVRCAPGGKASSNEKLIIVPGSQSASGSPIENTEPEAPAKANKAQAVNGKGGHKSDTLGDGGDKARWQKIRSEVQSNQCLVMGVGENFLLATLPLFTELRAAQVRGAREVASTTIGNEGEDARTDLGDEPPGKGMMKEEGARSVLQDKVGEDNNDREVDKQIEVSEEVVGIDPCSPFVLCLDFRLDLAEALVNIGDCEDVPVGECGDVEGGKGDQSPGDKKIRIVSCADDVAIWAIIRLWKPADTAGMHVEAENSVDFSGSDAAANHNSGEASSLGPLPAGAGVDSKALEDPALTKRPPEESDRDDEKYPSSPTWYLHSLSIRSGIYVGTTPCAGCNSAVAVPTGSPASPDKVKRLRPRGSLVCNLAEWHALALVVNKEDDGAPILICVDGHVLPLQQEAGSVVAEGMSCGERELLASGAVVIGGIGREWSSLAVKNLAVYNKALDVEQLRATTRVFRVLEEEQRAAQVADDEEEERWSEEARRAEEEEREPNHRPERVCGTDLHPVLERRTVCGEAKIDRIVLPKAVLEGGEWILRVEDVSHQQKQDNPGAKIGTRAAPADSSVVTTKASANMEPAECEECDVFPPLPGAIIKLERA